MIVAITSLGNSNNHYQLQVNNIGGNHKRLHTTIKVTTSSITLILIVVSTSSRLIIELVELVVMTTSIIFLEQLVQLLVIITSCMVMEPVVNTKVGYG